MIQKTDKHSIFKITNDVEFVNVCNYTYTKSTKKKLQNIVSLVEHVVLRWLHYTKYYPM